MSDDYYYNWRDIGFGPVRTKPMISHVIGNFDDNNNNEPYLKESDFCSVCQCELVYIDRIKKKVCRDHGCNLTPEEQRILSTKREDDPTIDKAKVLPNRDIEIDEIATTTAGAGIIRKNEGGFTPMKRGANSDAIARREEAETGGGYTVAIPSRRSKKKEDPNDFDPDGLKAKLEAQGAYIISSEITMPKGVDVKQTYNSEQELYRQKQMRLREPFEVGPVVVDNDENSGLKV
jgi:hypothetical protein